MAKTKEEKKEALDRLQDIFKSAGSVTFVNFHGLTVTEQNEMRSQLKEKGVGYYVAKKTLTRKALAESGFDKETPQFEGELAIASSEDETASAREIYEFQKKYDERIRIQGGIFEGKLQDKAGMMEIAMIPGMDVLRGMFVNVINSPIQGMAIALAAIAERKA